MKKCLWLDNHSSTKRSEPWIIMNSSKPSTVASKVNFHFELFQNSTKPSCQDGAGLTSHLLYNSRFPLPLSFCSYRSSSIQQYHLAQQTFEPLPVSTQYSGVTPMPDGLQHVPSPTLYRSLTWHEPTCEPMTHTLYHPATFHLLYIDI